VQKQKDLRGGEERRRVLTIIRIVLWHNKNFRGMHPKRFKMVRTEQDSLVKGLNRLHTIVTFVSLYMESETCQHSLVKGDAPPDNTRTTRNTVI
jgi:hypothetical protein